MIKFINEIKDEPYIRFKEEYDKALYARQKVIEAISIASFSKEQDCVDARYVNLKFIDGKKFIFFSNYNSPKSSQFESHNQISASIYWHATNVQIRMKASIEKTSKEYNQKYFFKRSIDKNALAISSNQSKTINSYDDVEQNYIQTKEKDDLKKCPEYWGGFAFTPYCIEFWEGHDNRLNKRCVYEYAIEDNEWKQHFLQP